MSSRQNNEAPESELNALELRKIIPLAQVTEITTLSEDSLKRHYSEKIRHLSPRRRGMTLGDALAIGDPTRHGAAAPPDPGIRPGGIRDRALKALAARTPKRRTK